MSSELVGKVTQEERDEILAIFERKIGIQELLGCVDGEFVPLEKRDAFMDKMITEAGKNQIKVDQWWDTMLHKYGWKTEEGKSLHIDFGTCEIFLEG